MAKVELKAPVVAEIAEAVKDAQSVVLVDYRGLTVEQDTALRKQLRAAGVTYKVYKNTMMNFAFKGTDFEALAPYLEGPSAIAISTTDATAPARELANFAKTADKLEIKGGVVEGNAYDAAGNSSSFDVYVKVLEPEVEERTTTVSYTVFIDGRVRTGQWTHTGTETGEFRFDLSMVKNLPASYELEEGEEGYRMLQYGDMTSVTFYLTIK